MEGVGGTAAVEIHKVESSVGIERAVRVAGASIVIRDRKMVCRAVGVGEHELAVFPRV